MENSYSQFKVIFFDVLKCDSTFNWEKKLLIIVNVLKFLHMFNFSRIFILPTSQVQVMSGFQ